MKLLILSESPLRHLDGRYYAVDPWIRIPISLSEHCEKVTLWAPTSDLPSGSQPPKGSWSIPRSSMSIEWHDDYNTYASYFRLWPTRRHAWRKKADELASAHDIVILRGPSPMAAIITASARATRKPLVFFILGDLATQVTGLFKGNILSRLAYRSIVSYFLRQESRCSAQAALTYAYSGAIARRNQKGSAKIKMIQDPHLRLRDIAPREDTCSGPEIRLLRICWLIPSKGIEPLLRAIALLVQKGFRVKLDIYGQEREKGYQDSLHKITAALGIVEHVRFLGWLPFDKTGEAYLSSDIHIVSSLAEGTPRVVVEGFARGLPTICSNVGGCADTLIDGKDALLVSPGDSSAIAQAVERLIQDASLRRALIHRGYQTASASTFERLGMELLTDLRRVATGEAL